MQEQSVDFGQLPGEVQNYLLTVPSGVKLSVKDGNGTVQFLIVHLPRLGSAQRFSSHDLDP